MSGKCNKAKKVSLVTDSELQQEIRHFDTVLDTIQQYYPEHEEMWDYIANIRDDVFRLQQVLRKCKVVDDSRLHEDPLIDLQ